jgi:hypothetical protein
MGPAGRVSYAESGHFVACIPCLGRLGCFALPLVGIKISPYTDWKILEGQVEDYAGADGSDGIGVAVGAE